MRAPYLIVAGLVALALLAGLSDQRPLVTDTVESGFQLRKTDPQDLRDPEAVHLIYWEKWNGFEGEAMQDTVDRFNERSKLATQSSDPVERHRFLSPDGQRIIVHMLSTTHVNRKTLLAVSGGIPPDLAGLWSRDVPDFAYYDAAMPLDEWIARDGPTPDEYHACYWDMCVVQDRVWALPTTPSTIALHWNKDLFKEAGLDPERPPRTLAELDAFNRKLTKRDQNGRIVQMGFIPHEPGWWHYGWGNWFGGAHCTPDGRTITCDSPEWIAAYEWLNKMAEFYGREEVATFKSGLGTFDSPQNAFIAGKVAMVIQGVWMANFIRRYNPAMKWGAAPFPGPGATPGHPVSIGQADVLLIPRGCPHPEEAWKFARYVNSIGPDRPDAPLEGMEILCLGQGKHSPFKKTTAKFRQMHRHEQLGVFNELSASKNVFIEPLMPMWKEYRLSAQASFEELWNHGDKKSPAIILKELKTRLQPKLDGAWAKIDYLQGRRQEPRAP